LAYGAAASLRLEIPRGSKITMGRKAVTGTGIASVAHQIAIHNPTAAVRHASAFIALCHCSVASIRANTTGPKMRPTIW
jgi:hypothetical protein